jgi:hypothetical protein
MNEQDAANDPFAGDAAETEKLRAALRALSEQRDIPAEAAAHKPEEHGKESSTPQAQAIVHEEALKRIEIRALLMSDDRDPEVQRGVTREDVDDFDRIQDPAAQRFAAELIATNARESAVYRAELEKSAIAQKIEQLEAERIATMLAKEERKTTDYESWRAELQERARNWSPEEASAQAKSDLQDYAQTKLDSDRFYLRQDMALNAAHNTSYQTALEKDAPELVRQMSEDKVLVAQRTGEPRNVIEPELQQEQRLPEAPKSATVNRVESDEVFTATQAENQSMLPGASEREPAHAVKTFEDKESSLETQSDSEGVAQAMVRTAQARGWDKIKVSGSEVFRQEVWLEAASRGMHVKGYSPDAQDEARLANRQDSVQPQATGQENPAHASTAGSAAKQRAESFVHDAPEDAVKKHPQLVGAIAAMSAIDKKVQADGLDMQQRSVVMARVRHNIVHTIEQDELPQVKLREEIAVKKAANEDKEFTR